MKSSMNNISASHPVDNLICKIKHIASKENGVEEFVRLCHKILCDINLSIEELVTYVDTKWNVASANLPWIDSYEPPYLLDMHTCDKWSLRLSIWADSEHVDQAIPHSHYGYIIAKAITTPAYIETIFKSDIEQELFSVFSRRVISYPNISIILPQTIHKVEPIPDNVGVTLSVRTKAIVEETYTLDNFGRKIPRRNPLLEAKSGIIDLLRKSAR